MNRRSRWLRASGIVVLTALNACSGGRYADLRPEVDHPRYAEHVPTLNRIAQHSRTMFVATEGDVAGEERFELAVHRPEKFTASRVCILLHGALSDHRTFRYLHQELQTTADVVLIDLPGCGASAGWTIRRGRTEGYTVSESAARVRQAISVLLEELAPSTQILLVGHSYGGAVAIDCMCGQSIHATRAKTLRDRIDGLILIAPYDVSSGYRVAELEYVARINALEVWLARWSGLLTQGVASAVWEAGVEPGVFPREEADRMIEVLSRGSLRCAAQYMLLRAAPWQEDGALDRTRAAALAAQFATMNSPCLILWGAADDTLPISMGEALCAKLPTARLQAMPACKHSPQIEAFERCAEAILEFAAEIEAN